MRVLAILAVLAAVLCGGPAFAGDSSSALNAAFVGARIVDLRTSRVSSVVTLRDKVGIPAPSTPVLLKVFDRKSLPPVLRSIFADPRKAAVTIDGRYVAVIRTELHDEYDDLVRHELVHAYITLASPKPLPLWFQEGSAVHYSMGKDWKFYGQPSRDQVGVVVGKTVELPEDYKQKLQTFNYIMQTCGEKKFNAWYKEAVESGNVDPRPLLGLEKNGNPRIDRRREVRELILGVLATVVVFGVVFLAYFSSKRSDYY